MQYDGVAGRHIHLAAAAYRANKPQFVRLVCHPTTLTATRQANDVDHEFRVRCRRVASQPTDRFTQQQRFDSGQWSDFKANQFDLTAALLDDKFVHLLQQRRDERSFMHGESPPLHVRY
jgi:hypothetical protein